MSKYVMWDYCEEVFIHLNTKEEVIEHLNEMADELAKDVGNMNDFVDIMRECEVYTYITTPVPHVDFDRGVYNIDVPDFDLTKQEAIALRDELNKFIGEK